MSNSNYTLDLELITKRAISGVVTFTFRSILVQFFTFFATFVLTVLLEPSVLGVFFVVSAILNFFVYFSDIGLAAALVQKKEEPTHKDLATTFTIQQLIIFSLVLIGLASSASVAKFYNLDSDGLMLLRVLIFSLILSSLKTIPSILLERKLNFTRLVIPQIAENIIFYSTAVVLAFLGFGISSFTWAVLTRGIVGLFLIYILSPWSPAVGLNSESAKKLTSFGVPFQINSILALAKDDLLIIFLGKVLPFAHVGYVGWAQKWALTPLRFFLDSVNKVTFPAYSRLQSHTEHLGKAIEKSLFFVTYFVYPSVFGIVAIAPSIINLVPNYEKWNPALPLLYLFAINSIFASVSTTFTNALFAVGRSKIVLNFMVFWTIATWGLTYPLVLKFGYLGVGIASALVASTSIATVYFVKREIPITVGRNVIGPLFISVLMFLVVKAISPYLAQSIAGLILTIIIGAIIYFASSFAIFRRHLIKDAMVIIDSLLYKKTSNED